MRRQRFAGHTQHLRRYADDGRKLMMNNATRPLPFHWPEEVLSDMENWAKNRDGSILWVEGPAQGPFCPDLSVTAVGLAQWATRTEKVNIGFFCVPEYCFDWSSKFPFSLKPKEVRSYQQAGLIALLYSLILQMTAVLAQVPPVNENVAEYYGERFKLLKGDVASIPTALELFSSLLDLYGGHLFCFIDGIHLVSSEQTDGYLTQLLNILQDLASKRKALVFLTTGGTCSVLAAKAKNEKRGKDFYPVVRRL